MNDPYINENLFMARLFRINVFDAHFIAIFFDLCIRVRRYKIILKKCYADQVSEACVDSKSLRANYSIPYGKVVQL